MKICLSVFSCIFAVYLGQHSPSHFGTDTGYITASKDDGLTYNSYPVDVCYVSKIDRGYNIETVSYQWLCEGNDNGTSTPKYIEYEDNDSCSGPMQITPHITVSSSNCYSNKNYQYVEFIETTNVYDDCTDDSQMIYDGVDGIPNGDEHTAVVFALNLCNNGFVLTCTDTIIYQWNYDDIQCQTPNSMNQYEIFKQTSFNCSNDKKILITQCNMTDIEDPFATTTTTTPTRPATTIPSATPAPTQTCDDVYYYCDAWCYNCYYYEDDYNCGQCDGWTVYCLDYVDCDDCDSYCAANSLSCIVNFVVLFTVSVFVTF